MMIEVRNAQPSDIYFLSDFGAQMFAKAHKGAISENDLERFTHSTFNQAQIELELNNPSILYQLVCVDDVRAGYSKVNLDSYYSDEIDGPELSKIYIDQSLKISGLGSQLMKSLILNLKSDHSHLWLRVWAENQHALQFYRKWGFEKVKEEPYDFGDKQPKGLVLVKRL